MAKTLEQIGCEQRILLSVALSLNNKTYKEVITEFIENCKKLEINDKDKLKAMMNHFNFFVNNKWSLKCPCCDIGNEKVSKLQWNRNRENKK